MKTPTNEMKPYFQKFIRDNMANRALTFYYKQVEGGIKIYSYHTTIWTLVDLAEQTYGWAALHEKGDPITRVDDLLSFFLIREAKIC